LLPVLRLRLDDRPRLGRRLGLKQALALRDEAVKTSLPKATSSAIGKRAELNFLPESLSG